MHTIELADFPIPKGVKAFYSTRRFGVSKPPFDSFNIALHVGDNPQDVLDNRAKLPNADSIAWLQQVHSARCIELTDSVIAHPDKCAADASFTRLKNAVCAVMTADCLPILICDQDASCVAAVHAGWRGLAAGVVENTIANMSLPPERLLLWVGPHITAQHFEVGEDVLQQFKNYPNAFKPGNSENKFYCDLFSITAQIAASIGITQIFGGNLCNYSNPTDFYSYRRSVHQGHSQTGRMMCGIYLE